MPDNLQFDRVEPAGGASGPMTCKSCGALLTSTYYVVNGHVVCDRCRFAAQEEWDRGGASGRFAKALGLGVLATIGCSVAWYVVLIATDRVWGVLGILVGLAIGRAVNKGSNGRGGWKYQALAIALTYTAIVFSYVPLIIDAARERGNFIVVIAYLYAMPFLAGFENVIGIFIIGIALYEAWKLNRPTVLRVSGPHQVSASSAQA